MVREFYYTCVVFSCFDGVCLWYVNLLSGLTYNIHKFGSKALFPPELKIKKTNFNQKLYST